jgi:hypothetical protein
MAARSKAWAVFALSNTGIVGSNLTWVMDVCVRLFCVQAETLRRADPRPRNPTYCIKDRETEKVVKVRKRAVEV